MPNGVLARERRFFDRGGEALRTIDGAISTPGLDLASIDLGDLATGTGQRGRADQPEVQALALASEAAVRRGPVPLGGVAPMPEQADSFTARRYRALVVAFDWSLFQRGCAAAIEGRSR